MPLFALKYSATTEALMPRVSPSRIEEAKKGLDEEKKKLKEERKKLDEEKKLE